MASSHWALVILDSLCRRLLLPLALLSAVVFRYNLFSLLYLLLFVVGVVLPSPRLKAQKVVYVVYLIIVLLLSLIFVLSQTLFQISLETLELDACDHPETVWRQIGFVQFTIPVGDVLRLLLPDVGVLLSSVVALILSLKVVTVYRKDKKRRAEAGDGRGAEEGDGGEELEVQPQASMTPDNSPPFPSAVQSYCRIPLVVNKTMEFFIFILLGLTGITVPSLTSLTYYLCFLFLLCVWSLHLRPRTAFVLVVRCLRVLLVVYATLHLVLLDLYQFQSAQYRIPISPNTTTTSLLVRLFGLTPVISTDCAQPTRLTTFPGVLYTSYVSPGLLVLLLLFLATDLRLWLFTPRTLWKVHRRYYLPILDHIHMPPSVVCLVTGRGPEVIEFRTRYGSTNTEGEDAPSSDGTSFVNVVLPKKMPWTSAMEKVRYFWEALMAAYFSTSYIFAIIAMMIWSVVFPSWPSLILLLWACAIWLFPGLTPRQSMLYTSPLLVLYAVAILLLQYVYSLDLGSRLHRSSGVVLVCDSGLKEGCKSLVLLAQTFGTLIFFGAFRELVRLLVDKWRRTHHLPVPEVTDGGTDSSSTDSPDVESPELISERARLYEGLRQLIATYWVLVVVGSFLLVILLGDPSLFKAVYLIFFFAFLITYQVAERWWFYFNYPLWLFLIVYAAAELVLVYTYQFPTINDIWSSLYNSSGLADRNISEMDLYVSIGLERANPNTASLIESLFPPAIFIAVMAMQLRFFKPTYVTGRQGRREFETSFSALNLSTLVPVTLRKYVQKFQEGEEDEAGDSADDDVVEGPTQAGTEGDTLKSRKSLRKQGTLKRQATIASMTPKEQRKYKVFRFFLFLYNKTRSALLFLLELFWRFLELHLHKVICLVLFATTITQISLMYWALLIFLLTLVVPIPFINPLTYPLMTFYLGLVTIVKMVYQVPVVMESQFEFSSGRNRCMDVEVEGSGEVFNHTYSPQGSTSNWLGLHRASDFANYVALPIVSALLLTLWFSARRYVKYYYHSKGKVVDEWERGSLFLQVRREEAETNVWAAIKYLTNHTFEMYGIEICWCMLAITVAVRIDVYGVFYALALALLLIVPRRNLFPVWVGYLVVHGVLLLVQYFFLLGRPPGFCLTGGEEVYPWSVFSTSGPISENATAFKKWLFLPADDVQILDRSLLYADFLVFLLLALQAAYFNSRNPLTGRGSDHDTAVVPNFLLFRHFIDYIKVFLFQYYLWVTLFLIFISAVVRVSLLGMLYVLLVFYFMYRGRQLFQDTKHKSWTLLRWVSWGVLTVRVAIQIWSCVFSSSTNNCLVILLFNGACTRRAYYGGDDTSSSCDTSNIGLWVDAFNFIVITIQMILLHTSYMDNIRNDINKREGVAITFRNVFDAKVTEKNLQAQERKTEELEDLKSRASALGVTSYTVDHLLHAGVIVPDDVVLRHSREPLESERRKDTYFEIMKLKSPEPVESAPKMLRVSRQEGVDEVGSEGEEEETKEVGSKIAKYFSRAMVFVLGLLDDLNDLLEKNSALFREVVMAVQEECGERGATPVGEPPEVTPLSPTEVVVTYGATTEGGDDDGVGGITLAADESGGEGGATGEGPVKPDDGVVPFDRRAGLLDTHIAPSPQVQKETEEYQEKLVKQANEYTRRLTRLGTALYYVFLANNQYVPFFFVILSIIVNGSLLSLIYAVLLFGWGLLSVPWPSKRFWLALIFYTMFVLVVKYAFQFGDIGYWDRFDPNGGLYPPRLIGIEKQNSFVGNAVVDILLLIFLLIHRGLLFQYGLWRSTFVVRIGTLGSDTLKALKLFFKHLVDANFTLGSRDYYVIMLVFDLLCFVTIIFGVNSFGVGVPSSDNITAAAEFIQTNQVPIVFVVMLLLQFLSMLVDRAIYLRHSLMAKLVFQVFLLVVWHAWLFFLLPSPLITNRPFTKNPAAQSIYFFKACYFIVSSFQLTAGYPTRVLINFLATKYTTVSWLAFNVYRVIPVLPELREIMDWVFTDTTLSLINWLKVQEIYAQLYLVKVQRNREKGSPRDLGQKQSLLIKVLLGVVLLSALVLLIWGPLLVISLIGATSQPNQPTEVSIKLNLAGFEPLVELTAQDNSINRLSDSDYNKLIDHFNSNANTTVTPLFRDLGKDDFRRITIAGNSTSLWVISPPARDQLVAQLRGLIANPNTTAVLEFDWTIARAPSTGLAAETVSGSRDRTLRYPNDESVIQMFLQALDLNVTSDTNITDSIPVALQNLFPVMFSAPANGASDRFPQLTNFLNENSRYIDCNVVRSLEGEKEWWSLSQDLNSSSYILGPGPAGETGFLELFVYSERVAPAVFNAVTGLGIIGLYVSVVLVIGRFIRSYISSLPTQLLMNEILYPERLLELCKDIFLVRESKHFRLEEILVGKLFFIFRSPRMVVRLTEQAKLKTD